MSLPPPLFPLLLFMEVSEWFPMVFIDPLLSKKYLFLEVDCSNTDSVLHKFFFLLFFLLLVDIALLNKNYSAMFDLHSELSFNIP